MTKNDFQGGEVMGYVRFLEEVGGEDISSVGGKGANLGKMIAAGLPVPEGFVLLTHGYRRFVEANALEKKIARLVGETEEENAEALERVSTQIQRLFEGGKIPEDILAEMDYAYRRIGKGAVAVRSSATAEDLPGMSFAGQYNTYLNVQGKEELYGYVKKCWASLWNYRALSYRLKQKMDNSDLAHGVVVQRMINAEKSGILFTANPVNGRRDQMLLNSSWGLGEAVVGGEVTPDQWVMDRATEKILEERIAKKEIMTLRKEKGIEFVPVPREQQETVTLDRKEVSRLLQFGEDVEEYFGSPQDIEWAFAGGRFYLVQTRPITSLYPMPQERNNKKGLRIYLNMNNYSQAMPEPFTPMGEDIIRTVVKGLAKEYGKKKGEGDKLWW